MSKTIELTELLKAALSVSDMTGKSLMMMDIDGNLGKINVELDFFKLKCRSLFGTDRVIVSHTSYVYTVAEWKKFADGITGYGGFNSENSVEGDIVVAFGKTTEGSSVVIYARGTSSVSSWGGRQAKGLLLEIEGYQPYWSSSLSII